MVRRMDSMPAAVVAAGFGLSLVLPENGKAVTGKAARRPCPSGFVSTIHYLFGGKGNPSAGAGAGFPSPQAPHPFPSALLPGKSLETQSKPVPKGKRSAYSLLQ